MSVSRSTRASCISGLFQPTSTQGALAKRGLGTYVIAQSVFNSGNLTLTSFLHNFSDTAFHFQKIWLAASDHLLCCTHPNTFYSHQEVGWIFFPNTFFLTDNQHLKF